MNITKKIIITDTNVITDLSNADILEKFVNLDNVYISDIIKSDEVNYNTGDVNIINKFKEIRENAEQISKIDLISKANSKLSPYDIINYILAKDNNAILATGDQKLKDFCESNGVEVIRTLKIIRLMREKDIISTEKLIDACTLLKENSSTRIPSEEIDKMINEYEKDLVNC